MLDVGYTPQELMDALQETRVYLAMEHPSRGCIGCERCTRVAMLDIAQDGIADLVDLLDARSSDDEARS